MRFRSVEKGEKKKKKQEIADIPSRPSTDRLACVAPFAARAA